MLENRDKRGAGEFHAIGNDEKRVFLPFFHGCRVPDVNVLDAFGIGISCLEDFLFDLFRTVRRIFHFEGAAVSAAASIARVHRGLHFIGIGVVTEERSRCASGDELDGARGEFLENIHSRPFPVCPLLACEHEEFLAEFDVFLKSTGDGYRPGAGARLLDAAGGHAGVFAVDQDSDVVRARDFLHDVTDVGADAFLNLEAAGYGVCDAGDLGKVR